MGEVHQGASGFADVNGGRLYYEVAGSGQPLLLIHAGVADSRMWDNQWSLLAQHYRVIRYDIRGFGQSALTPGAFASYEDAAELLRFLNIERAHVIGMSWGGKIAIDLALAHPEMVQLLVLGAPSVGGAPQSEEVIRFGQEEDALLERGDLVGATELNLRMWVDGPHRTPEQIDPVVRERVREMQFHAFSLPFLGEVNQYELEPPAIERLNEIRAPTLVIVGDLDVDEKVLLAQRIVGEVVGARLVTRADVGHMVSMERPDEFNQIVLKFLQSVA